VGIGAITNQLAGHGIDGLTSAPRQKHAGRGWRLSAQSATQWLWRLKIVRRLDWPMFHDFLEDLTGLFSYKPSPPHLVSSKWNKSG
jgi:hypothetical protein